MSSLGPVEVFVIGLFLLVVVLPIWGAIDAARRPDRQWTAVGQSQTIWVIVLLVGLFVTPVGVVAAIVYFTTVRPKLRQAG